MPRQRATGVRLHGGHRGAHLSGSSKPSARRPGASLVRGRLRPRAGGLAQLPARPAGRAPEHRRAIRAAPVAGRRPGGLRARGHWRPDADLRRGGAGAGTAGRRPTAHRPVGDGRGPGRGTVPRAHGTRRPQLAGARARHGGRRVHGGVPRRSCGSCSRSGAGGSLGLRGETDSVASMGPRVAIVTGSESDIGRAVTVALAVQGHDVGITWPSAPGARCSPSTSTGPSSARNGPPDGWGPRARRADREHHQRARAPAAGRLRRVLRREGRARPARPGAAPNWPRTASPSTPSRRGESPRR